LYLPHKKADVTYTACPTQDVTYTNAVKTKKPYTKYAKPDVIDLTEVNVNDTKEIIFPKVEDFNFNVDVDELSNEFNTETQLRNLDESIKAIGTRLDTINTTLFHGGGSDTHQANAINSMSGVVNAMSKVVTKTYTKAEETHQHALTAIATLNASRRENTEAWNKLLSDSSDTVFSDRACEEIKSCCEFAHVAQAHKINDSLKERKAEQAQDKVAKRNKKAREKYAVNAKEKSNEKRNRRVQPGVRRISTVASVAHRDRHDQPERYQAQNREVHQGACCTRKGTRCTRACDGAGHCLTNNERSAASSPGDR
jgi:hypothetical protein